MSAYRDWKVGEKVVCIDDASAGTTRNPKRILTLGAVYTVRGINHGIGIYRGTFGRHPTVLLDEVSNEGEGGEADFAADRFRLSDPSGEDA